MSLLEYQKAMRRAEKDYRQHVSRGEYPYLQVLDEILTNVDIAGESNLGLVQIPINLIVGTKTAGRRTAFASNFMPLLKQESEFASKWGNLCDIHLKEGIRDPIKAYEFMNRFYIMEGNKRVSVLKFYDSVMIPGYVTRILPKRSDSKDIKTYYEFVEFYRSSRINYILFSEEGRYQKLLRLLGKQPEEFWTDEERNEFSSNYFRFEAAYLPNPKAKKLPVTVGDAFLAYLDVYGYSSMSDKMPAEIKADLGKIWDEIELQSKRTPVKLMMNPANVSQPNIISKLLTPSKVKLKVAFVYDKTPETSSWTYGHELGRLYLEQAFAGRIQTCKVENISHGDSDMVLSDLILTDNDVIFTTTPQLIKPSLKAAIEHPDIKILNCSLNTSHKYIRTYYCRMYEAKFLSGIAAGAMCDNGKIGYIADYPIYGMTANINAFALGVKMVNPHAQIYLQWSKVKGSDPDFLKRIGVSIISNQDLITPNSPSRQFGLYHVTDNSLNNMAMPMPHWGKFYERLIHLIHTGSWNSENSKTARAINYWWGFSAGVIDVIYSKNLPSDTRKLLNLLKREIARGYFNPFSGTLYSQDGIVQADSSAALSPESITTMDWLCDNIIGAIPTFDQLNAEAQALVSLQGVDATEKE